MIGIVGARDTVDLVVEVAREMALDGALVPRGYDTPAEAPRLGHELEAVAHLVLFTGPLPYLLASRGGGAVPFEYIPFGGADLYRVIATLLLDPRFRGRLPKLSLDSIEASDLAEGLADLGLTVPAEVTSVELLEDGAGFDPVRLAEEHRRLRREGKADVCLTCVGSVFRELRARRVPAIRVTHSRRTIREALGRAHLSMQLGLARMSQVAVCIVRITRRRRSRWTDAALARLASGYADRLGGNVVRTERGRVIVLTTKGSVDRYLRSVMMDATAVTRSELEAPTVMGVGLGHDARAAEEQAERALAESERRGDSVVVFEHGSIVPIAWPHPRDAAVALDRYRLAARDARLPTGVLYRLLSTLRAIDPSGFTAADFASAYGVTPRSGRRLLARLQARGLVEPSGVTQGTGRGRPQRLYRARPDRVGFAQPPASTYARIAASHTSSSRRRRLVTRSR